MGSAGYSATLADGLRARHLITPMEDVKTLEYDLPATDAAAELDARQFAAAPVTHSGVIVGIVERIALGSRGQVDDHVRPLYDGYVVSAGTALHSLFELMQDEQFVLVLEGSEFIGALSPVDLGRPPARTYFYLLLAQLEISLAEVVRHHFPDQARAVALLDQGRRLTQRELVDKLRADDDFLDDVAALGLADLLQVARCAPELASRFEAREVRWAQMKGLGHFRNDVMHPVRDFLGATNVDVGRLLKWDRRLRMLLDAASDCGREQRAELLPAFVV
jgi:hypothetical protein